MPPKRRKLKVVKVQLNHSFDVKPLGFPPMPRLYLDYLENKTKVKPQLRNVEYEPKDIDPTLWQSIREAQNNAEREVQQELAGEEGYVTKRTPTRSLPRTTQIVDVTSGSEQVIQIAQPRNRSAPPPEDTIQLKEDTIQLKEDTIQLKEESKEDSKPPSEAPRQRENDPILDMLRGNKSATTVVAASSAAVAVESSSSAQPAAPPSQPHFNLPPSIAQINSGKVVMHGGIRDISNSLKSDEQELSEKRDMLFKFRLLKRGYKHATVPEYNEYSDLATMKKEYEMLIRQLHIDAKVEKYKKYITYGFTILEFLMINMLNLQEAKGLCLEQQTNMEEYDRLLIKLGEKSSSTFESTWSPEMQLGWAMLVNTVTFVGMKMMYKATGQKVVDNMSDSQPEEPKKTRMKGPDMSDDDLSMRFNKKNL